jgi:hypothetical protein
MGQLLCARALYKQRNKCFEEGVELPLLTTTAADDESLLTHVNCPLAQHKRDKEHWKLAQGWFGVMGGIGLILREEDRKLENGRNCITVTRRGIVRLAGWDMLPGIPKSVVLAKGKSSRLAKALVVFQASWMFIQTIAREIAGLPATLLELNTIAHVCCAFIMYAIWWGKPQDADELIIIDVSDCVPCSEHLKRENFKYDGLIFDADNDNFDVDLPLKQYQINTAGYSILIGTALIYGGIHLTAWNAHFPTFVEQILWRVSACIVMGDAIILAILTSFSGGRAHSRTGVIVFVLLVP